MIQNTPRYSATEIERAKEGADIAGLIGATVELKRQGDEFVGLCPFHHETTPSFTVVPKKRMYYCFGCGASGDAIKWLQETGKLNFNEAIEQLRCAVPIARAVIAAHPEHAAEIAKLDAEEQRKRMDRARKIWNEAEPGQGTLVQHYLASRGLAGIPVPPNLRFHKRVWHPETESEHPAMVASIIDHRTKQIIGIHRTYLSPDGRGKAKVSKAKLMLGICRGGHVQLSSTSGGRLAIAEGIETSLSVVKACPNLSVWAALSLTNMSAPVPRAIVELILCADGDNKDQQAADRALSNAAKLHQQPGRTIRIARPERGKDFNDMMRVS